jgi:hypothetical protein
MSNVARPLTAATRPLISANTQIPTTPRTVTHAKADPNRAPTRALVTRSPMSTNPPIAVNTPNATAGAPKPFGEAGSTLGAVSDPEAGCPHLRREPYQGDVAAERPDDPRLPHWFRCLDCGTVYREPPKNP